MRSHLTWKTNFWIIMAIWVITIFWFGRERAVLKARCTDLHMQIIETKQDAKYYRAQMILYDAFLRRAEGRPFAEQQVNEALENLKKLNATRFTLDK